MEFIDHKPIIYVLSGKSGSGKSKSAEIIKDIYYKKNKKSIIVSYATPLKEYAKNILSWNEEEEKPREFLQQVGVELIKNKIDKEFLIKRVIQDIKVYSYFYDVIIVSDARFVEEIECLKEFDKVISIHINSNNNELTEKQKNHSTETGLDNYNNYNNIIDNNSTVYNLKEELESIVGEVNE